jgi:hypothetical protein
MLVNPLKNAPHRMKLLQSNNRHAMKKPPLGAVSHFFLCQQRTGFKRRPACDRPGWVPESSGGEGQGFHLGG